MNNPIALLANPSERKVPAAFECCGSPKFLTLDHRISPGGERRGGLGVSLRDVHWITS